VVANQVPRPAAGAGAGARRSGHVDDPFTARGLDAGAPADLKRRPDTTARPGSRGRGPPRRWSRGVPRPSGYSPTGLPALGRPPEVARLDETRHDRVDTDPAVRHLRGECDGEPMMPALLAL